MLSKLNSIILNNSTYIIITTAVLFACALFFIPKIHIDNSVDVFFNKKGDSYIHFQEWKDQFGSDELIIVAFTDENIFTKANLGLIDNLTEEFEVLTWVDNVRSLTNVNNIIGHEKDFIVEKLVEDMPADEKGFNVLREAALDNPLYTKNIISEDGKTTAILVELEKGDVEKDSRKKETIESIKKLLEEPQFSQKKYYISGLSTIEYYYALYMQDDLKTFMPFMFMIIIAILYISFRKTKIVLLPLMAIGISLSFAMAFLYFLGYSINNVTTLIPPLLMAIMIADSIHLVGETIQSARDNDDPIRTSMRSLFFPCLLTTITTSVGFLSLTTSTIPPVRELGIVVGVGVFFALIITFTFLPAVIKNLNVLSEKRRGKIEEGKEKSGRKSIQLDGFLKKLAEFNEKNRILILIGTVGLIVFSIMGILRINVETSVLEYFRKSSNIYSSTMFVEENISGVHTLNISLEADTQDHFKDPEVLSSIEKIHSFLYTIPEVDKVVSPIDYIKDINMSFHNENMQYYSIPHSKELVSQYLLLYGREDLDDFVDSKWQWATIRVRLKEHNTIALDKIMKRIDKHLRQYSNVIPKAELLGQTVLEVETNNMVTSGQIRSLGLAMIVIFFMMFLVFRSISVGLISIVPNILPILINFGIMGWFGIRLDSATSMIAAMGIGIVVDDTIHYLHSYGEALRSTGDHTKAMCMSLADKGRPIILTSIILFFGFGVLTISKFVPTSYFGLLSAMLMINALLADLIILPCILMTFRPKFNAGR